MEPSIETLEEELSSLSLNEHPNRGKEVLVGVVVDMLVDRTWVQILSDGPYKNARMLVFPYSENTAETATALHCFANIEIVKFDKVLNYFWVSDYRCSSVKEGVERIVAVTEVGTHGIVHVVGTDLKDPLASRILGKEKPKKHDLLIGYSHKLPRFFVSRLVDGEIVLQKDTELEAKYNKMFEEHSKNPTKSKPVEPPSGYYLSDLRPLNETETRMVMQPHGWHEEFTEQMANLYIRDAYVAAGRLCEYQQVMAARAFSMRAVIHMIYHGGGLSKTKKIKFDMTPSDVIKCLRMKSQHTWRVGCELQLKIPQLVKYGKGNIATVIIDYIKYNDNDGSATVTLVISPLSADLFDIISRTKTSLDGEECDIGIMDQIIYSNAEVIQNSFSNFFRNKFMFERWCGRHFDYDIEGELPKVDREKIFLVKGRPLDASQHAALFSSLETPGFTTIAAPPGSGKTFLIAATVDAKTDLDPLAQFGIGASTNIAVTNAVDSVHGAFPDLKVCREFSKKSTHESLPSSLVVSLRDMANHADDYVDLKKHKVLEGLIELKQKAHRRLTGQLKDLPDGLHCLSNFRVAEREVRNAFLLAYKPQVLGSTSSLFARRRNPTVSHLIIDEAAQMNPIDALAMYCTVPNLTFVTLLGDSKQLPPFQELSEGSHCMQLAGRGELLRLESLETTNKLRLKTVYRCHPGIVRHILRPIYGLDLEAGVTEEDRDLAAQKELTTAQCGAPFLWVNINGSDGSKGYNNIEAEIAIRIIHDLLSRGINGEDIAVICHHKAQKEKIIIGLKDQGKIGPMKLPVGIHTVDSFQGKEAKVTLVLTTKTIFNVKDARKTLSFVSDPNRETVAVSRAQHFMYILGDWKAMYHTEFWGQFKQMVRLTGAMVDHNMNPVSPYWLLDGSLPFNFTY